MPRSAYLLLAFDRRPRQQRVGKGRSGAAAAVWTGDDFEQMPIRIVEIDPAPVVPAVDLVALVTKSYDGKMVEYLDIGPKFLDDKRVLSKEVMPDLLHLTPAAYQTWADSIEAHVARMMGETK